MNPVLELIHAFRRSKTMFVAVQLGIFDALESRPQSAARLAHELHLDPGALTRLLDACRSLDLLSREGEMYRNTPTASRYLVSSSPDTLAGYIIYSDHSLYRLWEHLDDAVREGSNRWTQTFGSRDALFAHFFRDDTSTRSFLAGMHGFGQLASPQVVRAFDLSAFSHLADLGGATGHLAIAACKAYPDLRATVLDLPPVEPFAKSQIASAGLIERVTFVGADFFEDTLPPADLYALGRILHDWDEPRITSLLSKIASSLPAGGGLLIAETLVNDDHSGPVYTLMQDLNMLVCTEGRERTHAEYAALLNTAGFSRVDSRRTDSLVDAILAIKG
jgi:acetylserotonin O-methyltransferase